MMYYSVITWWLVIQFSLKSMPQSNVIQFNQDIQLHMNVYQLNQISFDSQQFNGAHTDHNSSRSNK